MMHEISMQTLLKYFYVVCGMSDGYALDVKIGGHKKILEIYIVLVCHGILLGYRMGYDKFEVLFFIN